MLTLNIFPETPLNFAAEIFRGTVRGVPRVQDKGVEDGRMDRCSGVSSALEAPSTLVVKHSAI